jgi:hypothetical protein
MAVAGGDLKLRGEREPPAGLLVRIQEHKAELIELLWAADLGQAVNDDGGMPISAGIALDGDGYPCRPCPVCCGRLFWKPADLPDAGPGWRCHGCELPSRPYHGCGLLPDADAPLKPAAEVVLDRAAPDWTDDRAWIALWRDAGSTLAGRKPVLEAWFATAPPPPLPRRLAAVELRRIAQQHGIEVEVAPRDASGRGDGA